MSARSVDWNPLSRSVPIELFVMSKCPDKVECEEVFSQVLKQVSVPISLDVNYIGKPNISEPYGIQCKHGPTECLGNIQELCFKQIYPDIDDWFDGFTLCLNEEYQDIGEDNDLAIKCAKRIGKDYDPVQNCITSLNGIQLLTDSVERTQSLNVEKSCTIYIDNKLRCIHDGSWKECDGGYTISDFVHTIEEAYNKKN
ncbi:hypothetical protein BDC45DRAFT_433143 [Circinella umbellata]|nr:hypothetical protein BDC45DRAFT_433143 [Circinella umbellata]